MLTRELGSLTSNFAPGRGAAVALLAGALLCGCGSDDAGGGARGGAAGSAGVGGTTSGGAGGTAGGVGAAAGQSTGGLSGAPAGGSGGIGAGGAAGAGAGGIGAAGSAGAAGAGGAAGAPPEVVEVNYDFKQGAQGWRAGFADYAEGMVDMDLDSGIRDLPTEVGPGTAFMLQGHNRSDDLYMFLKRSVGPEVGVRPLVTYRTTVRIEFASNAQRGCVGIGGAPGESVFLKYGTTPTNPVPVLQGGVWRMNVDKGDQGNPGPVGTLAGDIANGQDCDGNPTYVSLSRSRILETNQRSDTNGVLWLLLGTDSGYEGFTRLYYQTIHARLEPIL